MSSRPAVVGAILAGGRSSRFGSDKRRAELSGISLVERVRASLSESADEIVLVTGDGRPIPGFDLRTIPDLMPASGPLGGIHAALLYAQECGASGALVVGCDTPFLPPALLRELATRGGSSASLAIAAESGGRRGIEPLCAWYSCAALPAIEAALNASRLSPHLLLSDIDATRIPLEVVRRYGDPARIFRNVNTVDDLAEAERVLDRL